MTPSEGCNWLERHHAVAVGEQLRHVGRGDPAPPDLFEIVVVRPTGDGATLSDEDRHFVVAQLGEKIAEGRNTDALERSGVVAQQ